MKRSPPPVRKARLKRGKGLTTKKTIARKRSQPRRQSRELDSGETDWSPETRGVVRRRSGGLCEWAGCNEVATDMHHRKLRRFGDHRPVNCLHLCDHHHNGVVHAEVLWARGHGFIVRSDLDPEDVVIHHGCPLSCQKDHVNG